MAVVELEPFNVETGNYQTTIEGWRRRLGEISQRYSHNRPVLPVQENPPRRFFDIVLRRNAQSTQSVRVRFNMGNFYLIGYQMANQQWLEFGDKTELITGSTPLRFDGSYLSLERAAGMKLESVTLGQGALLTAVDRLATATTVPVRAESLIVVIQMICESSRLIPISDRLTLTYRTGSRIAEWMTDLVRSWDPFSTVLLRADAYPDQSFTLPANKVRIPKDLTSNDVSDDSKIYKITTLAEAANILGILLGLIFRRDA